MSVYRGYTVEQHGTDDHPETDIYNMKGDYRATIPTHENDEKVKTWIDRDIRDCYLRDGRYETFEL